MRAKRGNATRKRHKRLLKLAKGYYGGKSRNFRAAREQVLHSLSYAYRDRRQRRRDFRRLWIVRIGAASRLEGVPYSQFMKGIKDAGLDLDRKVLADIAARDPEGFKELVTVAKSKLA